jgi:hypothetical protein
MVVTPAVSPKLKILSQVPGRVRFYSPEVARKPRKARAVEAALQRSPGVLEARANPTTGRILVRWNTRLSELNVSALVGDALPVTPFDLGSPGAIAGPGSSEKKARSLIGKLILGSVKLSLIFLNRLVWGAFAVSPLGGTIVVLSVTARS